MTQSKIEQLARKKLLPANLFSITAQFGHLLETYPNVPGNSGIYGNYKRNTNKLDVHTLEEAFNFVEPFIVNGIEYKGHN